MTASLTEDIFRRPTLDFCKVPNKSWTLLDRRCVIIKYSSRATAVCSAWFITQRAYLKEAPSHRVWLWYDGGRQAGRRYVTGDEVFGSWNEKNAPSKHDLATALVALVVDAWPVEKCKLDTKRKRHTMRWQQCSLTGTTRSRMTCTYEVLARFLTSFSEFLLAY